MFTGIITQVGEARPVTRSERGMTLAVSCTYPRLELGESIAVDGVCLTVATIESAGFTAYASEETLSRSTIGDLRGPRRVNLERALAVGDRLGGHIVAGHVDGVGEVQSRTRVGESERWTFVAPREVLGFLAVKGSVAIDGVSLTVNAVGPTTFDVMLVPHTISVTTLRDRSPGTRVNLEVDVLARYVARALETKNETSGGVSMDLLARAGFLDR